MENFEETRPSLYLTSFASSAFKNSVMENVSEDSKKLLRNHTNYQTPFKEVLTSRGYNFLTPRTQFSLTNTQEKDLSAVRENISKVQDNYKSVESNFDSTLDEDFKDFPTLRWCASCCKEVCTQISYKNSAKTFWASVGIFLTGGVCGCCMVPYMINSCKDVVVSCSRCNRELNTMSSEN